jgi:hypothetical protein
MIKSKKMACIMLTFVLALTMLCSTGFAISDSDLATGYGTIFGSLDKTSGSNYHLSTSITTNPDTAFLRCYCQVRNSAGASLGTTTHTSARVAVGLYFTWNISSYPSATRIYSTHEVKGGSIYGPKAVYLNMAVS